MIGIPIELQLSLPFTLLKYSAYTRYKSNCQCIHVRQLSTSASRLGLQAARVAESQLLLNYKYVAY